MRYAETGFNLEIDLTQGSIERVETDPRDTELYLGGLGTNAKLIWDRVPPEVEPFSDENLLIFGTGLLCGTPATGCNRTIISTVSPQTGLMAFSMLGGFFAVAFTDLIQGIIMISALVILPLAGLAEILIDKGEFAQSIATSGQSFVSLTGDKAGCLAFSFIVSGLSWGFGYMGQPHLLTRFMSIKDAGKIKFSRRIAIAWVIPAFTGGLVIGLVGLALYGKGYFDDVEQVMPHLANALLPPWISGIFISGAIAAMMSTADSQLLVISSSVIEDIYHKTLNRKVSEKLLLKMSRAITIIIGIFAFLIAITSGKLIFSMVSYAWAGLGASFGPALFLTLKWKKTTWQGVLAGMIAGTLSTVIWSEIEWLDTVISSRLSSFVLAFLTILLVSKLKVRKE